jgi:hypothetical protein
MRLGNGANTMYEVDFLPIEKTGEPGPRSGDAIAVRFTDDFGHYRVVVIDGGYKYTGESLIQHLEKYFSKSYVDLMISTHPDMDHINGLTTSFAQGLLYASEQQGDRQHARDLATHRRSPRRTHHDQARVHLACPDRRVTAGRVKTQPRMGACSDSVLEVNTVSSISEDRQGVALSAGKCEVGRGSGYCGCVGSR